MVFHVHCFSRKLVLAVLLVLVCVPANAAVYVRPGTGSGGDGTSWDTACTSIQAGILRTTADSREVWVAAGTYVENVYLLPGVKLYGGFRGDETSIDARDPKANETVIDGNHAGNALSGASNTVVDGFTVRNGGEQSAGYGVCLMYVPTTISNCRITGNNGAGIYCYQSSPSIVDCEIISNSAPGILAESSSAPVITGCTIYCNYAGNGAGLSFANCGTPPRIDRCTITGNHADPVVGKGGAISCTATSPIVTNCVIAGNSAAKGGGIYCYSSSSPTITNCTIAANTAALYGGAVCCRYSSSPQITNCILADNAAADGQIASKEMGSEPVVNWCYFTECNTRPFLPAEWNPVGSDQNRQGVPLFVNAAEGDYHLQKDSPCVDTGDASALSEDLDGNPRPCGHGYDVGAYEYTLTSQVVTASEAKALVDGVRVTLSDLVVTAVFAGAFYAEQSDRSAGIRVSWDGTVSEDSVVTVTGTLTGADEVERVVIAETVTSRGSGQVNPIGLRVKDVGGSGFMLGDGTPNRGQPGVLDGFGLNNIGLLITVWGKAAAPYTDTSFHMDDGSALVKVALPSDVVCPEDGMWIMVTGISSCEACLDGPRRIILPRRGADIMPQ